jgi:hypothetical protein
MAINFKNLTIVDFFADELAAKDKPKVDITLPNILRLIYQGSSERSGPWIAGGMGRQIAIGETSFNDIDVWFRDKDQLTQVQNRLQDAFGYEMYEKFASDNAMTYKAGNYTIQLIKRKWYPSLDSVFADFDFTCCQVAVDDDMSAYGPGIDDAKNKILKLNRFDEKAFLARYAKYVGYGYVMDPDAFIKIIENNTMNYDFDGTTLGY